MSLGIRGQEATIRLAVDGQIQDGSYFKVEECVVTPIQEFQETDFNGEDATDFDVLHHGFKFTFKVRIQDRKTLDYLSTLVARQKARQRPPNITMTITYAFRDANNAAAAEVLHQALVIDTGRTMRRKEYIMQEFEGRAKTRDVITA